MSQLAFLIKHCSCFQLILKMPLLASTLYARVLHERIPIYNIYSTWIFHLLNWSLTQLSNRLIKALPNERAIVSVTVGNLSFFLSEI